MEVEVVHALSSVSAVVGHDAIARRRNALDASNFPAREQELAEERAVVIGGISNTRDRLLRNDEHVDGCHWLDIAEGKHRRRLVDDVRRDLPVDDLLEDRHQNLVAAWTQRA